MAIEINPDIIYTVKELAKLTGYNQSAIYKSIKEGKIYAKKLIGREYLIKGSEILKALEL